MAKYTMTPEGEVFFKTPEDELKAYAFLTKSGKYYNRVSGEEMGERAFNSAFQKYMPKKSVKPASFAIEELGIPIVYDTLYEPRQPLSDVFFYDGRKYINAMRITSVPKINEADRKSDVWKICEEHVYRIFDDTDAKTIIQWLAHNVQKPGEKVLWAPILLGIPGDGKTTITNILAFAMGESNVNIVGPETLDSAFNSYATGSCVVALEEVRIVGKSRFDVISKLKPLIANPRAIDVVKKGKDGMSVPNVTNYIALTNHADALILDDDDRRWTVCKTKYTCRDELLKDLDENYWRALHLSYKSQPGCIRHWLMNVDISDFDAMKPPPNSFAKNQMIENSRSTAAANIKSIIGTADGVGEHIIANRSLAEALKQMSYRMPEGRALTRAMKELGFVPGHDPINWNHSSTRYYYKEGSFEGVMDTMRAKEALDETKLDGGFDEAFGNVTPFKAKRSVLDD